MGAPYIYDISRLRVKDLHSATYIYVVRRLRVNQSLSWPKIPHILCNTDMPYRTNDHPTLTSILSHALTCRVVMQYSFPQCSSRELSPYVVGPKFHMCHVFSYAMRVTSSGRLIPLVWITLTEYS